MQKLPLPSLMIVNSTTNHHHFPDDDPSQLTVEAIVMFLEQTLSQTLPVRIMCVILWVMKFFFERNSSCYFLFLPLAFRFMEVTHGQYEFIVLTLR